MPGLSRQGKALLAPLVCAAVLLPHLTFAQSLPPGWSSADVGEPAVRGSSSWSGNTITARGAGTGIHGKSDQFHFVYRPMSGDIDIAVLLRDLESTNASVEVGLMVRESLNADAKFVLLSVDGGQQASFQMRSRPRRRVFTSAEQPASVPVWLRLTRVGNTFSTYISSAGSNWTQIDSAVVSMTTDAYVGLAVTSGIDTETAEASFSSSSFAASSPPLPLPWKSMDVGSPVVPGTASATGGVFTVKGAGTGLGQSNDQLHFMFQPVTGDVEIVARIENLEWVDAWTKAGVMIRASLTPASAHAALLATGANGWGFQARPQAGTWGYYTAGKPGTPPGWLRLVRQGSMFSAYTSQDGAHWELLDSDTISMPATVYIGLMVTSQNASALATAMFRNVAVTPLANTPPVVTISQPGNGASFTAPANITIGATASDADGSVARVDFYANSQLLGSDPSSPYSLMWSAVPPGSYTITAVAVDDDGATASSPPLAVVVKGAALPPPVTTNVAFTPSSDHATNVTSYVVQLRLASGPTTLPVASLDIGKPAVVNGAITVNITALLVPLPVDAYVAIVVAVGPGGSAAGQPSAPFVR